MVFRVLMMHHHEHSWCIMSTHDASWGLMMHHEHLHWVFRTKIWHPICHQMGRHGSWEDFDQTNFDDFSARIFANFEISRFPLFLFLNFYGFVAYFGRHRGPPRISLRAAGATRDHFGGILCSSDFSRNPKITKNQLVSVSRDGFRRNSRESMRNRCPVIFQPSVH